MDIPAKSGVSGPVLAVIPRQVAMVTWPPPLDSYDSLVERLRKLAADRPNMMIVIHGNLAREFSECLRRTNKETQALG